jgi:hypothetical protein
MLFHGSLVSGVVNSIDSKLTALCPQLRLAKLQHPSGRLIWGVHLNLEPFALFTPQKGE